jgi:hypothetical protein
MATVTINRTTVARNPQDTKTPGAPTAQTAIVVDAKSDPIVVQLGSLNSRGLDIWPLTVGESISIAVT